MCSNSRCEAYNDNDNDLCDQCHKDFVGKKHSSLICVNCNTIYSVRRRFKNDPESEIIGLCGACSKENKRRKEEFYLKNPQFKKKK